MRVIGKAGQFRNSVIAALISSGSAGVCLWVVNLLSKGVLSLSLGVFFEIIISMLAITLVPNLLGLIILAAVLSRKDKWVRPWRNGLFIPVGLLYGQAVMLGSALLFATLTSIGLRHVRIALSVPYIYVMAALGGITAVGILVLLETRSSRTAEQAR